MLSSFLPYNKVIQLYMYTHSFIFRFFSHRDYHRTLGRVPCARQQVSVGQSFHIPQCKYNNPKPQSIPPKLPVPFGNHRFVFKVRASVSVLQINLFVSFFFNSTFKWIKTMWCVYIHIYTMEYYPAIKNETMPFVATWVDERLSY